MAPEDDFEELSSDLVDQDDDPTYEATLLQPTDEEICNIEVKEVQNGFEVYEVVSPAANLFPGPGGVPEAMGRSEEVFLPFGSQEDEAGQGLGRRRRQAFEELTTHDSDDDFPGSELTETAEKVKNKFKSMWNNVRYGWTVRMKTNFSTTSPIVLLGRYYFDRNSERPIADGSGRMYHPSIKAFTQDFTSRLWFTYRRGFAPLGPAQLTTDCGWGCMIRTGQMLLGQALLVHFLGREWSLFQSHGGHPHEAFHRQIVRWFADAPGLDAPFSIHNLVEWSRKEAGQWFGPVTIAQALQTAFHSALTVAPLLNQLRVYVAYDNCVYLRDLLDLAHDNVPSSSAASSARASPRGSSSSQAPSAAAPEVSNGHNGADADADGDLSAGAAAPPSTWHALLVIIPLWLGGAKGFNPIYEPCLKSLLADDSCVGIIGGRPKHSMYFVGWQDEKLIYLDPHYCQETVPTRPNDFSMKSYHCLAPRKIPCIKLDPSCAIGFYLRSRADVEKWVRRMREQITPPMQKAAYHMFEFRQGSCREEQEAADDMTSQMTSQILRVRKFNTSNGRSQTDEYVLL